MDKVGDYRHLGIDLVLTDREKQRLKAVKKIAPGTERKYGDIEKIMKALRNLDDSTDSI